MKLLNKDTAVPLGVIASVLVGCLSISVWLQGRFTTLDYGQARLEEKVDNLGQRLERNVTASEFRSWVMVLRANNPTLKIEGFPF